MRVSLLGGMFVTTEKSTSKQSPHDALTTGWLAACYVDPIFIPRAVRRRRMKPVGISSLAGLCSAHLTRKPPRYRSLSSCPETRALSYGLPGRNFPQHIGPRQRGSRLAVYADFAQVPIATARDLYRDVPFGTLPDTMASGIVFPLDQIVPAHQGFLRHVGERGENPSLGSLIGLRAGNPPAPCHFKIVSSARTFISQGRFSMPWNSSAVFVMGLVPTTISGSAHHASVH